MRSKRTIQVLSCHAEGEVGDVIIGGGLTISGDVPKMELLRNEWLTTAAYSVKVLNLRDGSGSAMPANAPHYLVDIVLADPENDLLTGGASRDYFWGLNTEVLDLGSNETVDL